MGGASVLIAVDLIQLNTVLEVASAGMQAYDLRRTNIHIPAC